MLTATDKGTIRIVVIAIALLALVCVGAVVTLTIIGDPVPSVLDVTTGTSVGALVALLSSTRSGAGAAEAVQAAALAQGQPLPIPGVDGEVAGEVAGVVAAVAPEVAHVTEGLVVNAAGVPMHPDVVTPPAPDTATP